MRNPAEVCASRLSSSPWFIVGNVLWEPAKGNGGPCGARSSWVFSSGGLDQCDHSKGGRKMQTASFRTSAKCLLALLALAGVVGGAMGLAGGPGGGGPAHANAHQTGARSR